MLNLIRVLPVVALLSGLAPLAAHAGQTNLPTCTPAAAQTAQASGSGQAEAGGR